MFTLKKIFVALAGTCLVLASCSNPTSDAPAQTQVDPNDVLYDSLGNAYYRAGTQAGNVPAGTGGTFGNPNDYTGEIVAGAAGAAAGYMAGKAAGRRTGTHYNPTQYNGKSYGTSNGYQQRRQPYIRRGTTTRVQRPSSSTYYQTKSRSSYRRGGRRR